MRGMPQSQPSMWCRLNLEELVEPDHLLRAVKRMADRALSEMSRSFSAAYAANGARYS